MGIDWRGVSGAWAQNPRCQLAQPCMTLSAARSEPPRVQKKQVFCVHCRRDDLWAPTVGDVQNGAHRAQSDERRNARSPCQHTEAASGAGPRAPPPWPLNVWAQASVPALTVSGSRRAAQALLSRCFAFKPEERPTFLEVHAVLRAMAADPPAEATPRYFSQDPTGTLGPTSGPPPLAGDVLGPLSGLLAPFREQRQKQGAPDAVGAPQPGKFSPGKVATAEVLLAALARSGVSPAAARELEARERPYLHHVLLA